MLHERTFGLKVQLEDTGEIFPVQKCHNNMMIGELKSTLELVTGIPTNLQRLFYMDDGEMPDNVTLQFNGIIKDSTIKMKTWHQDGWQKLLHAAAHGDINELVSLGVTKNSKYTTPNSKRMNDMQREAWIAERASVALFIAAHRGHIDVVKFLLMNGANPRSKTIDGHTALHMAAFMARTECIDDLLLHGADAEGVDSKGRTLLDIAGMTGRQENIGKIYQIQWMKRTAGQKPVSLMGKSVLFAHQMFDSTLKTWRSGTHGKLYMSNLLKSGDPRAADTRPWKHPGPNRAGKLQPTGTARTPRHAVSTKQAQKPKAMGLGNAQVGKPPTQPQDAWQKETTGTKAHGNSNVTQRPDTSSAGIRSDPLTAAHPLHKTPTRTGKAGASRKK
ncbi:ankyrin repeat domain-containing protein 60-like [Heterodontus francisci]|uniref:ankyrin repeat domain-containing protein 60-like n=1 Tax=Heterodontus francisci TaxID=7792 RepID=UPI00355B5FE5